MCAMGRWVNLKLLPNPRVSISLIGRPSKSNELLSKWYNASDTTIVMNKYARISVLPAIPLPSRILLAQTMTDKYVNDTE